MIIKKGEWEYLITEQSKVWRVERTLGGVTVEYKIPKDVAPDQKALGKYIQTSKVF